MNKKIKMKLTKAQKERNKLYARKIKLLGELNTIQFGHLKKVDCVKCKKTIEVKKILECRNQWITAMNKNKTLGTSDSEFPFGIVQSGFQSTRPFIVCKSCRDDIYRFMGKIPDLYDSDIFPQKLSTSLSIDKFMDELKSTKKPVYHIRFGKKEYKDSPGMYDKLLNKAVKSYVKKYPYIKFTENHLIKILKNHKLQDGISIF